MKTGLETIIWGPEPKDFESILQFASHLGFQGVEVFQHPIYIKKALGAAAFRESLEEKNLELAGLVSGTLEERVEFCEEAGIRARYLYVDEWRDSISTVIDKGYTVALHPSVYKLASPTRFFDELLPRDERLRLILDPAHLFMGGLDPLERLDDVFDRLVAVHLKDWGPWFGRSFHRYGYGFTELGNGAVPLLPFLQRLQDKHYEGWAILEQNFKSGAPEQSVGRSVNWLLDSTKIPFSLKRWSSTAQPASHLVSSTRTVLESTAGVLDTIIQAQTTPALFPDSVVKTIAKWADCRLVTLWAHCPSLRALTLVASYPIKHPVPRLEVDRSLCGQAIERKRMTYISTLTPQGQRGFRRQDLIDKLGLKSSLCVPILNRCNPNDIGMLLTLFLNQELPTSQMEALSTVAEYIGSSAERILADRCTRASGAIQELFPRGNNRRDFLEQCIPVIRREVECEAVSIFLENPMSGHLELAATTGITWEVPKSRQFYERGRGRTGQVLSQNVEYISIGPPPPRLERRKSEENCSTKKRRSFLFVPIRDYSGQSIGVARCRNKVPRPIDPEIIECSKRFGSFYADDEGPSFSQEDATVLQSICDAMFPRVLHFEAEERTFQITQKLTHELKMPLVGVNSQLDFIEYEVHRKNISFREDWINECRDSVKLMGALVENAEFSIRRRDPRTPPEKFRPVLLLKDIIAPVVDQMASLLVSHHLPRRRIEVGNFSEFPKIWMQMRGVSQVVFNLLNNAIKYRFRDLDSFHVKILVDRTDSRFVVRFQSFGPGVDESEKDSIFEMGHRGLVAIQYDVSGSGYGLSIARQIMRDHGGDLRLTKLSSPTEFTLEFPKILVNRPPR